MSVDFTKASGYLILFKAGITSILIKTFHNKKTPSQVFFFTSILVKIFHEYFDQNISTKKTPSQHSPKICD